MIGFLKKSAILVTVLLSATFAYAGDLRPAPQGGNNMHPAPQGGKETALTHVANETAVSAISKEQEDKEKLRQLRPAK